MITPKQIEASQAAGKRHPVRRTKSRQPAPTPTTQKPARPPARTPRRDPLFEALRGELGL